MKEQAKVYQGKPLLPKEGERGVTRESSQSTVIYYIPAMCSEPSTWILEEEKLPNSSSIAHTRSWAEKKKS